MTVRESLDKTEYTGMKGNKRGSYAKKGFAFVVHCMAKLAICS